MDTKAIRRLLVEGPHPFAAKHVTSLLQHFDRMIDDFRAAQWDECAGKSGKLVEAAVKALGIAASVPVTLGRTFKVDTVINALRLLSAGTVDEAVRLTIPRCCTFVYDIASNRGGRHDPDTVDANEMDAAAVVANCSWILAEMIRVSQRGAVSLAEARELVESLTERKYPMVETVEGRFYLHKKGKSGVDVAVTALAAQHPKRMSRQELIRTVRRNGFTDANARKAVERLGRLVDDTGAGELRLLAPGRQKADEVLKETQ